MDKKNIEGLLGNYMVVPEIQREYVWGSNKNINSLLKIRQA